MKFVGPTLDFASAARLRNLVPAVAVDEPLRKGEAASGGGGGSGGYTYSASAPAGPAAGDRWLHSDSGILYTYVNDGNSSQWVEL